MVGYRGKPDFWGEPLKREDTRSYRWSLAAIAIPNLGLLTSNLARSAGWHVGAAVLVWLAVALTFACAFAGIVAYRETRSKVRRDLEDMMHPRARA